MARRKTTLTLSSAVLLRFKALLQPVTPGESHDNNRDTLSLASVSKNTERYFLTDWSGLVEYASIFAPIVPPQREAPHISDSRNGHQTGPKNQLSWPAAIVL
ncbi:hypothetical protein AAFF_G00032330 [Aldrovandia affinis]|uniref:Uncharacterized protein n=1 Tax=Aldrovandia affinis TaxID=143900 RepID=A0AAD7S3V3_9TELE|nr:hypothetical protein AAFF_G00032330 [Aldrovandia affinis]